jgi:hypothetical protein
MQLSEEDLSLLADSGYHCALQLHLCTKDHLLTYVALRCYGPSHSKENSSRSPYYKEQFTYLEDKDCYVCPQGAELHSDGVWHERKKPGTYGCYKNYRTPACAQCPVRGLCTKRKQRGRVIERTEYERAAELNKARMQANREVYVKRKAIIEHPFGTIKRGWGFDHVLLKGLEKVDGEVNLIGLVYNWKRSCNILGFAGMLDALNNWTPDYKKVLRALKKQLVQVLLSLQEVVGFLAKQMLLQKRPA